MVVRTRSGSAAERPMAESTSSAASNWSLKASRSRRSRSCSSALTWLARGEVLAHRLPPPSPEAPGVAATPFECPEHRVPLQWPREDRFGRVSSSVSQPCARRRPARRRRRRGRSRRSGCRRSTAADQPARGEVAAGGAEVAGGGVRRVVDVLRVGDPVAVAVGAPRVPGRRDELHRSRSPAGIPCVSGYGGHVARAVERRPGDLPVGRPSACRRGRRSCRAATRPSRARPASSSRGGRPGRRALRSVAARRRGPRATGYRSPLRPCGHPGATDRGRTADHVHRRRSHGRPVGASTSSPTGWTGCTVGAGPSR